MSVNTSQSPYFDDYDPNKEFYKILFVPSRAVQVRELNQLQSIIHTQIERIGEHTFDNGSVVVPGEVNYNTDVDYAKVTLADYSTYADALNAPEVYLVGSNNGVEASLDMIYEETATDPLTFNLTYYKTGSNNQQKTFDVGEVVSIRNSLDNEITTATVDETGLGSSVTVADGVFYVDGYFVKVDTTTIALDKYTSNPSYSVGFEKVEETVDSNDDISLLDNAAGSPNFNAPGAHRLRISMNLVRYTLEEDKPNDFVEIIRIENGEVQKEARGPNYNILGDVLAERTYDESGDYTVDPFQISIDEHSTDDTKYSVSIEGGLGYVRGYQVENLGTRSIAVDKARTTESINNSTLSANLGYYIEIDSASVNNLPNISELNEITFYDGADQTGNVIGSAHVRSYARKEADYDRLYIFKVRNAAGETDTSFIENAVSVSGAGTYPFNATIYNPGGGYVVSIRDSANYAPVFKLSYSNVKTLLNNGTTDTTYTVIKQVEGTTDSSGNFTYNAGTGEVFPTQNGDYSLLSVTQSGSEEVIDYTGSYSLGGTPTGKSITINLGIGYESKSVRVNILTIKQADTQKAKTPTEATVTGSLDGEGVLSLGKADAYNIVSILDNSSNDITEQFDLYANRKNSFYDVSYVKLKSGYSVSGNITVTFDYFLHGSGNYFSVDSYSAIAYDDIPTEVIDGERIKLSDVIDFRPRIDDTSSDFTSSGGSITNIPVPNDIVRMDLEHYMGRIDKLIVDYEGNFSVKKGVPSSNPKEPNNPDNSMSLYVIEVPAYTADVSEINSRMIDNERYTMKDIGKLENRIKNLEYYTTLNQLEQETADLQVVDAVTGLNRFKNGFITDKFIDHSVGNFDSELYKCAISDEDEELRPEFNSDAIDLVANETSSSNVIVHDDLVTLPYTHNKLVDQPKASSTMNVNPYAVRAWIGKLKLNPASDTWYESRYVNPNVIYRTFNNGRLTARWSSWRLNWSGGRTSTTTRSGNWNSSRTTTTTTTTNVRTVNDRVLSTDVIPFMRQKTISVTGQGFRPFARVYPFFDDRDVSSYCSPSVITADASGDVSCTFTIPVGVFRTGEKEFRLIDNADGDENGATSYGSETFTSKGILRTRQRTIVATRSTVTRTRRVWRDPLAQSFLVDQKGGVFMTKVDLYFATKDRNIPVDIEIRNMENGYPGQDVVPYSQVIKYPSEVNTSTDASAVTTFTFDNPVYLEEGQEYCFVIKSNSTAYEVWVAGMGENEIDRPRAISKQPYVGVMFKSQNNSTWTADQTKDMKFTLYNAQFNTSVVGNLVMNNDDLKDINLSNNPFTSTSGSNVVEVYAENHGMFTNSTVTINGAVNFNGILASELNGTHTITEVINPNKFTVTLTTNASFSGRGGSDGVSISRNLIYDVFNPNIENLDFSQTGLQFGLQGVTGQSVNGTETPYQTYNFNEKLLEGGDHYLNQPLVCLSPEEESDKIGGSKSVTFNCDLFTDNVNVSPVIDLNRVSIVGVNNIINYPSDISGELTVDGSDVLARYLTRSIVLEEPANSIRAYMDINKPQGSDVAVYYRTGSSENEIDAKGWSLLDVVKSTSSVNDGVFYEHEYEKEDVTAFTHMQIKIVMLSNSSSSVPRIKKLRALALGT